MNGFANNQGGPLLLGNAPGAGMMPMMPMNYPMGQAMHVMGQQHAMAQQGGMGGGGGMMNGMGGGMQMGGGMNNQQFRQF